MDEKIIINEFEVRNHLIFCAVLPIDKIRKVWYDRRAHERCAPKFPLYHSPSIFVNRKVAQIVKIFFPVMLHKKSSFQTPFFYLHYPATCGIIIVQKGQGLVNSQSGRCFSPRNFLKKVKKSLDKGYPICYNKGVKRLR